ncbi:hypothetical protein U5N28_10875 [Lysinibacillus telephonicus]|uniref:Uncharacterized protein n=1 Tax=Lysinibacillus telephonicus TaxID=1714840 RepID=A0A431UJQ1_9BACI|nr:hypothetical protein [Lysinibacillus telephonicus]RTQ89858.1 hypothetical protein EKG35_15785 [Lysinibacillus telephonicus]
MRNVYIVDNYQFVHNNLHFSLNENENRIQIQPAGQLLADSDNLAFVYLLEEGEGYSYLHLPQQLWPQLVELLKLNRNPYLLINNNPVELTNFTDELQMLVFNIEGNDNYGTDFVEAVEKAFTEILRGEGY